jgi:hypothetical protein
VRPEGLGQFKKSTSSGFEPATFRLAAWCLNYYVFNYLKNWLELQRFNDNDELTEEVKTWLSSQAADFFDTSIQKLLP